MKSTKIIFRTNTSKAVAKEVIHAVEAEMQRLKISKITFEDSELLKEKAKIAGDRIQESLEGIFGMVPENRNRSRAGKHAKSHLARLHIQEDGDVVHIKSVVNFKSTEEIEKKYGSEVVQKYLAGLHKMWKNTEVGVYVFSKATSIFEGQTLKRSYFEDVFNEMLECGKALSKLVQDEKAKQKFPIKVLEI